MGKWIFYFKFNFLYYNYDFPLPEVPFAPGRTGACNLGA